MTTTLNKEPQGYLSANNLQKVVAAKGTGGFPRLMRRAYGGVSKLNIAKSPLAAAYVSASGRKKDFYADRVNGINAVCTVISLNHCTVSGRMLLRTMTELAMRAGLATYKGKVVLVEEDYQQMKRLAADDESVNMALYLRRDDVKLDDISISRASRAIKDLVGMGMIFKDKTSRNYLTKRYMGVNLYVEPEFYLACGVPEDESEKERKMLMAKAGFLKAWGVTRIPQSLTEARKLVADVVRERQLRYYRLKKDVAKNRRQLNKLASMDKNQLRHHVAKRLADTLSAEDLRDREAFIRMVEIQVHQIHRDAQDTSLEPSNQGQFFPQMDSIPSSKGQLPDHLH